MTKYPRISWEGAIVASLVAVVIFLLAGRAEATVATIDGSAVCNEETGEWLVTYQVFNDDPRPLTVTDQDPQLWPGVIAGKSLAFSDRVTLPGDALGHSATVIGQWSPDEAPAFLVGIVDLRERTCSPAATTTTTTSSTTIPTPSELSTTTTTEGPTVTSTSTPTPASTVPTTSAPTLSRVGPAPLTSSVTLTVPVPTAVNAGSELPYTGIGDWAVPLAVAGFALVILGVLAIMAERRKR